MGPARRWYPSGNLTGRGILLRAVGTRPGRGGSSVVPLWVGGGRDRTWRESAAGRREGSVRSRGPHLGGGDLGDGTSSRLSVAAAEVPGRYLRLCASRRAAPRTPGAMRVQVKVNAGVPTTFPHYPRPPPPPLHPLLPATRTRSLEALSPKRDGKFSGAWGVRERSGGPGHALVSCKAAKPQTACHLTYFLDWHTWCVNKYHLWCTFYFLHFGIVRLLVLSLEPVHLN